MELAEAETLVGVEDRSTARDDMCLPKVRNGTRISPEALDQRWQMIPSRERSMPALADARTREEMECYRTNIENFIGTVKVPVGVAGPLRVNGTFARGEYYVPLATTEAALVASYCRGAQLITDAGGCTTVVLDEGVSRSPGFAFATITEASRFATWAMAHMEVFKRTAGETTRHGRLVDLRVVVEGNHVYLHFSFTTGDAAGQNMVTIATAAICAYIDEHMPDRPRYALLDANFSGDKKASAQSFMSVRGKKVSAEVIVPGDLLRRRLRTTPERMVYCGRMGAMGSVLSGTLGVQAHFANALAALYIACGQDAACVAESAVGVARCDVTPEGDLYATVTLPNIIVGTVGGGTGLPSQQACLEMMGLAGPGHARALAEVCAAICLAGELSLAGAMCANHFARAHQRLARGKRDLGE